MPPFFKNNLIYMRIAFGILFALLSVQPAESAGPIQRVAIIDFQNIRGDEGSNWIGTGLAETLMNQLLQVRGLMVLERRGLKNVVDEINLGRTQLISPKAAQKMGREMQADSIILGSFLVFEKKLQINLRVINV